MAQFTVAAHGKLLANGVDSPGWAVVSLHSGLWVQAGMTRSAAVELKDKLNDVIERRELNDYYVARRSLRGI